MTLHRQVGDRHDLLRPVAHPVREVGGFTRGDPSIGIDAIQSMANRCPAKSFPLLTGNTPFRWWLSGSQQLSLAIQPSPSSDGERTGGVRRERFREPAR
jgi:hypothetical protein